MSLNIDDIITPMVEAVIATFDGQWPTIRDFAETETLKLAQTLVQIGKLLDSQRITHAEANILLEIQKNTARTVMLSVEGMGLILVEQAINSALQAVSDVVNTALGLVLL